MGWQRLGLIFVGGGAGAVLRYLVQGAVQRWWATALPVGTMAVNLSGCLVIGFLGGVFLGARPAPEGYRLLLITGLLGGYTTFSSFAWETLRLGEDREFLGAGLNVLLSVAVGLAAVWAGKQIAQALYGV